MIIHPATGVIQHLYHKYAAAVAEEHGLPVLIYDLRGSGLSERDGDFDDASITMSDWILEDVPSATRFMRSRFPDKKLLGVGHSVGAHGQFATQAIEPVDAFAAVASHAGITALVPKFSEKAKLWTVFNIVTPITAKLLGHVPTDKIGLGRRISVGVMQQWRKWTNWSGYFFDDSSLDMKQRFNKAEFPLLSVVLKDDLWATREASDVLLDQMPKAEITRKDLSDGEVGHMGFFRSKHKKLWPEVTDWLLDQA